MRVVVTGGAGFIGGHVVELLAQNGHDVIVLDALRAHYDVRARHELMQHLVAIGACRFEVIDLVTADLADHVAGADAVIHLAARPGVASSWGDAFPDYASDNLVATNRLLRAVTQASVPRMVVASSSSVYGTRPVSRIAGERLSPQHPYGVTKLATEELCRTYAAVHPNLTIILLRYFTVYGPRQRPDMAVSRFIAAADSNRPLMLHGGGCQSRRFTFVRDVAAATLNACTAEVSKVATFDIASAQTTTVATLADMIGAITETQLDLQDTAIDLGEPLEIAADLVTTREKLAWSPATTLEDGLHAQIIWTRETNALGLAAN